MYELNLSIILIDDRIIMEQIYFNIAHFVNAAA